MKKKIEQNTLKLALVCVSAFSVFILLFMLKKRTKTTTKTMNLNGNYTNKNSLAAINHNPTNIVKTAKEWRGEIETPAQITNTGRSGRFKAFSSDYYGIVAAYNNLQGYFAKGYNTIRKIITRWAPPKENNTDNYIVNIAKRIGAGVDEKLDFETYAFRLIKEIARIESGFSGDLIIQKVVNEKGAI